MTDLMLDQTTWDIAIVDGDLQLIQTKEDLAYQAVLITLRTFRGEWFKDITYGVPYLANDNNPIQLLGSKDRVVFDSYLRQAILANDEILSIISYESSVEPITGLYKVSATLEIESGEITITDITV